MFDAKISCQKNETQQKYRTLNSRVSSQAMSFFRAVPRGGRRASLWRLVLVWLVVGSGWTMVPTDRNGETNYAATNRLSISMGYAAETNMSEKTVSEKNVLLSDADVWNFVPSTGSDGWYVTSKIPTIQAVTMPNVTPNITPKKKTDDDSSTAIPNVGWSLLPFATDRELERGAIDYDLRKDVRYHGQSVDCTAVDQFELTFETEQAAAIGSVTLYLRSGDGWYNLAQNLTGNGLQTLVFPVSDEHSEGKPTGLHAVDGFRIAFWRGAAVDASVHLVQMRACRNPILILESSANHSESTTAKSCAKQMLDQLHAQHVPVGMVSESQILETGASLLTGRKLVILPYNPDMNEAVVTTLRDVMQNDASVRLLVFYQLPEALRRVAGFENVEFRYVRPTTDADAFVCVRFDPNDVRQHGYPLEWFQTSHNIIAPITSDTKATDDAKTARDGQSTEKPACRLFGEWRNAAGASSGYAAAVASERAIFFSHVLMNQDPERQRQMVTAMLGELWSDIWLRAAQDAVRSITQIGTYHDAQWLRDLPSEKRSLTSGEHKMFESLDAALVEYDKLCEVMATFTSDYNTKQNLAKDTQNGELPEMSPERQLELRNIVARANVLKRLFADIYIRSFASLPKYDRNAQDVANRGEVRAWWEHAGTGIYPGDWDRTVRELAEAGFTHIIPNMLWAGSAHYASDYLPSDAVYEKYGDQIAQAVAAGKKYGVEVHVWKVCYNLATAPQAFVDQMVAAGRTQVKADGTPEKWLCPSHPENIELEIDSMCEIVEKYDVDGIHFDYIRYPSDDVCFCDGCRQRFESQTGVQVEHWPRDCVNGPLQEAYIDWRCEQITHVVAAVHERAKKIRPEIQISAAVFPLYPSCRRGVLQDWKEWVAAGYLDFLCPMSYNANPVAFEAWIERELEQVANKIPVYPGIGATATGIAMVPDIVAAEIDATRRAGAQGFTIFNLNATTVDRLFKPLRPMLVPTVSKP